MKQPRKKDYIQRAHVNPFADQNIYIPQSPSHIDWSNHYKNPTPPTILDLGCGYGKFLQLLSSEYINENIIGFEIRKKVAKYAALKCSNLQNISVLCTNGLIFMQNFFDKNSLTKIFILFPDPHFKTRKHKARMVSKQTLDILYYLLEYNGMVYVSTDVQHLFEEMDNCFKMHCGFELSNDDKMENCIKNGTDEAMRAGVKSGHVFVSCYKKIDY